MLRTWDDAAVRFTTEHRFEAPSLAVMAAMVDGSLYASLELPDLGLPEVLEQPEPPDAAELALRLRYHYTGSLDPIARTLLGGRELFWLQEVRIDPAAHRGEMRFASEEQPDRLHGSAQLSFEALGNATVRRLDGEVIVGIPLVGGAAERRVIDGLLRRLEIESDAIARHLDGPGAVRS